MTTSHRRLLASLILLLSACPGSGDDTAETASSAENASSAESGEVESGEAESGEAESGEAESGETTGCIVTNECGSYDICTPGDGVIPEEPSSPAIVEACAAYCMAIDGIGGCALDIDACAQNCGSSSCGVCPGTLAPLVACRTQELDAAACTCTDGDIQCPTPAACDELEADTYQCGG